MDLTDDEHDKPRKVVILTGKFIGSIAIVLSNTPQQPLLEKETGKKPKSWYLVRRGTDKLIYTSDEVRELKEDET